MNPNDRRVKRSKRALSEALIALMHEKDYKAITVREITDRADVGYMTFYRYHENKDHLLLEWIESQLQAALASTESHHENVGTLIFGLIQTHAHLFRVVFFYNEAANALYWLKERITQLVLNAPNLLPQTDHGSIPRDLAALHIASSVLNLVEWWLKNRQPYSIEQMGHIYEQMILYPTLAALKDGQVSI